MLNKVKRFIKSHSNIHNEGEKCNVFIFSTPRSGSTWLAEIIWTQKGFKCINEPLNLRVDSICKNLGLNTWEKLYREESKQQVIDYFKSICQGRSHFCDPNPFNKYYRPITSRIVFKILHGAEYWINEIAGECNGKVVYLIRHPIAVSISRKQLPRIDVLCSDMVLRNFSKKMVSKAKEIYKKGDYLEKAVLSWCIQNKLALRHRNDDWFLITYEQLTTNPLPVLNKITDKLELNQRERLLQRLNVPSAVKNQSDEYTKELLDKKKDKSPELVEKWKKKISKESEKRVFDIVDTFEIDIYKYGSCYPAETYILKNLQGINTNR